MQNSLVNLCKTGPALKKSPLRLELLSGKAMHPTYNMKKVQQQKYTIKSIEYHKQCKRGRKLTNLDECVYNVKYFIVR